MVMLWLCCGYVVVILWLRCGYVVVMLWLCCDYVVVMLWLCCGYLKKQLLLQRSPTLAFPLLKSFYGYIKKNE